MDVDQGEGTRAANGAPACSVPEGPGTVQPASEAARKSAAPPDDPPAAPRTVHPNTVEFFLKEMKKNTDDIIKSFTSHMSAVSSRVKENSQRLYRKNGKSQAWHETDRRLQENIEKSKEELVEELLGEGGSGRAFYSATRTLASASSTPAWTVSDLFIGLEPEDICDRVLDFFGAIAGAPAEEITGFRRCPGGLQGFTPSETADMLRNSKKTDSRVEGDPLVHLIRSFPEEFTVRVSEIYNRINYTGYWPAQWKTEHLTIIPKKHNPNGPSECRNISCTSAF